MQAYDVNDFRRCVSYLETNLTREPRMDVEIAASYLHDAGLSISAENAGLVGAALQFLARTGAAERIEKHGEYMFRKPSAADN